MRTFLKVISGLISFILSISLFAVITLSISLFSVKRSFSEDSIKKAVAGIDFSSLIRKGGSGVDGNALPFGALAVNFRAAAQSSGAGAGQGEITKSDGSEFELSDELLQKLAEMGISQDMVEQYLSSDLAKDMAGKLLEQYSEGLIKYMVDGKTDNAIDAEFVHQLFADNMDNIEDLLGVKLSVQEKDQLLGVVDEMAPGIEKSLPAYEEIENSISESSDVDFARIREDYIRPFFSPASTIVAVSALVGICALLGLLRWSWYRWMIWAGIPMLFSGLTVLSGVIIFTSAMKAALFNRSDGAETIIRVLGPLKGSFVLFSAFAMALAVALIVLYAVFSSMAKKAERSPAFAAAAAYPGQFAGQYPYPAPVQNDGFAPYVPPDGYRDQTGSGLQTPNPPGNTDNGTRT